MKNSKILLSVFAFIFAIAGAITSNAIVVDDDYYGINPDTQQCEIGQIQDTGCNQTTGTRCNVKLASDDIVPAWDEQSGTACIIERSKP